MVQKREEASDSRSNKALLDQNKLFSQGGVKSLNEAWERYKSMLRKCLSHDFDAITQMHIFRNGLQPQPKLLLNATAGGSLMEKTTEEAVEIIERMERNDHQVQHDRSMVQKERKQVIQDQMKLF